MIVQHTNAKLFCNRRLLLRSWSCGKVVRWQSCSS